MYEYVLCSQFRPPILESSLGEAWIKPKARLDRQTGSSSSSTYTGVIVNTTLIIVVVVVTTYALVDWHEYACE